MITGIKERVVGRGEWFDYLGIAALVLTPATVMVQVLQSHEAVRSARDRLGPAGDGAVDRWRVLLLRHLDRVRPLAGDPAAGRAGSTWSCWAPSTWRWRWAWRSASGCRSQGYLTTILLMFGAYVPINAELTWREGLASASGWA